MPAADSYSIRDYGWMIDSRDRTNAWVEALKSSVRPGDVVLDIGTGTGLFAFLACRFGASKVYAVDPDDSILVAQQCVAANPGGERIEWIHDFSTEIELPEKVDVVIGDLHGKLPFHTGNLSAFIDARKRHLKEGGIIVPTRDVLWAAPAEDRAAYRSVDEPWLRNDYDVDFSAGRSYVINTFVRLTSAPVSQANLLAEPAEWARVEYATMESPNVEGGTEWRAARDGELHGIYVWFEAVTAPGISFSTSPMLRELPYGRIMFPLPEPVQVMEGDSIGFRFSANIVETDYIFRWQTQVTGTDGRVKRRFDQSNFKDKPFVMGRLRRSQAGFVPEVNQAGKADLQVLMALSKSTPLGEIAEALSRDFPKQFPTVAYALAHVGRLSVRYT